MKKYTIEDLKNLTDENLSGVSEAIMEKTIKFSDEEMRIICDKLYMYTMIYRDMNEYTKMSRLANHLILPNEDKALKEAYVAHDLEDWCLCKSALDVFFEWMTDDDILFYDLSLWNYRHLMRWFCMLSMTRLCDEPEGTTARIFACMVNEQIINRLPKYLKSKRWGGIQQFLPEIAELFDNSKVMIEDGLKSVDLSTVAKKLEMTAEEVVKLVEGLKQGENLVTRVRSLHL